MKKILYFSLLLGLALSYTSCQDEEDLLFDKSAAERLNEIKGVYSQRLWASPNGWAMQYYPTYENEAPYGTGYLMLCDFNNDYSVRVAMNNSVTNNQYKEDTSAWEIITDNGPVLTFNSFNSVIHTFSNPEDIQSTTDETETGRGYEGDYEFVIVDAPEDASYMMLKGKKRGTYSLLTPMEDNVNYEEYLSDIRAFHDLMFAADAPTFDVLHFGDSIYKLEDANDGIPNIYPYDGDAILDESFNPFLITKRGNDYYLRFRDKFKVNEEETVQDFRYDSERDVFVSVDNSAYYMDGDNPLRFYMQTIDTRIGYCDFSRAAGDMSEKFAAYYNDVVAGFKNVKATMNGISLRWAKAKNETEANFCTLVNYKTKNNATLLYVMDTQSDGEGITFQYTTPKGNGQNILNTVPALQTFLDVLSQKYIITASKTKFNLNTLKFTSASDPDLWFTLNYTYVEFDPDKTF